MSTDGPFHDGVTDLVLDLYIPNRRTGECCHLLR
jgi:hypothetical protein